jgi:hypothetical protein
VGSEEYNAKFSKYIAQGVAPEKLPEHFTKVKGEITAAFKGGKPAAVEAAPKPKAAKAPKEKAPKAPKEKATKKGGKKA